MTYDCSWKYRTLAALDGDLPSHEHAYVQRHIASCAICTALTHDLDQDVTRAKRATTINARVPFHPEVVVAAKCRSARRRFRRFVAASAVVVLALSAAFVQTREQQQVRADESSQLAAEMTALNARLDRIDDAIEAWRVLSMPPPASARDMLWLERAQTDAVLLRAAELFETELGIEYATPPETHVN